MLLPDETDVDLCLIIEQKGHDLGRWMSKGLLSATYLYPIYAASRNCFGRMTMKVFCYPLIGEHRVFMKILSPTLRGVPIGREGVCAARDANLHC